MRSQKQVKCPNLFFKIFLASPLEPYKRGRSASSSLIPFPRVGRSVSEPLESNADSDNPNDDPSMLRSTRSSSQFYGQKRTGKSSLIPFPRVGRRSDPSLQKWQNLQRGTPSLPTTKKSHFFLLVFLTKCVKKNLHPPDLQGYFYPS